MVDYVQNMTSPDCNNLLQLYQRTLSAGVLRYLQKNTNLRVRRGIYAAQVVLWLMMVQRLSAAGTLRTAVQLLLQGVAGPLLPNCRRVRRRRISAGTGGYCRARQKLPTLLCRQVMREMLLQLRQIVGSNQPGQRPAFLLDGSSLELEHCRELVRAYPPAPNQYRRGHWPVLRIVVMHDMYHGLAEEPCWGPMYGQHAVSEQELAEKAMDALPPEAVVVGDRNFGILWTAYAAGRKSRGVVLRLSKLRAYKLLGPISQEGDYPVAWKASRSDGGKGRRVPAEAEVTGRLLAVRIGRGKSKQWLYLFTTLDWNVEKIVELYGLRWNIETDLRSLKRTVRLQHVAAKSKAMMEKELIMATAAYNLVRAVMSLAAQRCKLDPRQLSFSGVLTVVNAAWPNLVEAETSKQQQREFKRVLDIAAQCKLPKRRKRRSYPRAVWRHGAGFPFRKELK
jgi:putative transposase